MRSGFAIVSPPEGYDLSGGAFNEVAEALRHGRQALGHDSVLTSRPDLAERRTIVLGGNFLVRDGLEPLEKAKLLQSRGANSVAARVNQVSA